MKRSLTLAFVVATLLCHAQIDFQKGYFIDNEGKRTECFIRDAEWVNNPTRFRYKTDLQSEAIEADLSAISEFGFENTKYVRATLDIDQSPKDTRKLGINRHPEWKTETVFLKLLIAGKADLYHYNTTNFERFFYSVDDQPIKQLVYKEYVATSKRSPHDVGSTVQLRVNGTYLNQLETEVSCGTKKTQQKQLKFNQANLLKYFIDYNKCNNVEPEVWGRSTRKTEVRFRVSPGVSFASARVMRPFPFRRTYSFTTSPAYRLGVEMELMLPFNKNKWSIFGEPTFHSYKGSNENSELSFSVIELPVGLRHYFFLNGKSKFYLNVGALVDRPLKYEFTTSQFGTVSTAGMKARALAGAGLNLNKLSVEVRVHTTRKSTDKSQEWYFDYYNFSVLLAYRIK